MDASSNATVAAIEAGRRLAGKSPDYEQMLERLKKTRVTADKAIPQMEFFFRLFGKPCFPRGELVGITGKAKSGKTFFLSMIMVLCARHEALAMERIGDAPLRMMWIDTEQSEESTQDILKNRINRMVGDEKLTAGLFDIFNLRSEFWQDRRRLIETAVSEYHPDVVVLDGVRDLVDDINDQKMSQSAIEMLMRIASSQHCCIVCVLHQNKASEDHNLRGALGTELTNKAFEVYSCTKDAGRLFCVEQVATRKYDIMDVMKYLVGDNGIPYLPSVSLLNQMEGDGGECQNKSQYKPFNRAYLLPHRGWGSAAFDVRKLFAAVMKPGQETDAVTLQDAVMREACIQSTSYYLKLRKQAEDERILFRGKSALNGQVVFCLNAAAIHQQPQQQELFAEAPEDAPF